MFWVLFLLLLLKTVIYDMTTREWLLFSANSAIFQLYHGENKLIFNEMMMRSAELDLYSASSLKQQSMGRHVAPPGHIILIPSQPVFALSP
jgi:hypothetical protein